MKISRAEEILNAKEKIEVKLEGVPIWIDEVDLTTQTAEIHIEDDPSIKQTVEIAQLKEE